MPAWQTWVAVAFDVAQAKGAQFESNQDSPPRTAQDVMSIAAEVWTEDTDRYRQMTEEQARQKLSKEITVSR